MHQMSHLIQSIQQVANQLFVEELNYETQKKDSLDSNRFPIQAVNLQLLLQMFLEQQMNSLIYRFQIFFISHFILILKTMLIQA